MQKAPVILLVDDDEEIGVMLKMMLEHKGFSVIVSQSAQQTETMVKNDDVDLVLLDMLIAGVKGTDVCMSLKNNTATSHVPVMIITALPDAETICKAAGADDFLAKPFDMEEMLLKVNHLINKKAYV
jgi:DNA-binding response OmpR family regulator